MTDLAALADELEKLAKSAVDPLDTKMWASDLGVFVIDNRAAILTALRASRPEPAADAVEAAATRVADATLCQWGKPGDCGREDNPCLCEAAAKAALSALPRPEADEGAVRKADEIFDDITRGGPTVDAVMREDWATVAEWMRQRAEDGLAVTRAAIAAALSALPRPSDAGAVEALAEAIARAISCHGDPPAICDCFGACDCTDEARKIIAALPRPEVDEAAVERATLAAYDAFFEGQIGCCEPSWDELPDSHKDRMRRSIRAALAAAQEGQQ